jgi:hypothetical protein
MNSAPEPGPLAFPPAPWISRGQMWTGFFRTSVPPALPADLVPVLRGTASVMLVRYLDGTLRYDELAIGTLARRGRHLGLFIHLIWVDDPASMWGGRRIWGLSKELATFAWDGDTVRIADASGPVATVRVGLRPARLPRMPVRLAALGTLDGRRTLVGGSLRGCPGLAPMDLLAWSDRLPVRIEEGQRSRAAFRLDPFRMTVPGPKVLGPAADGRAQGE